MADLFFNVRANYEEVINLQKELARLRERMREVDTTTAKGAADMQVYVSQYETMSSRLAGLVETAAKEGAKVQSTLSDADKMTLSLVESIGKGESAIRDMFLSVSDQGDKAVEAIREMKAVLEESVKALEEKKAAERDDAQIQAIQKDIDANKELLSSLDDLTSELDKNRDSVDESIKKYDELADSQANVEKVSGDMVDAMRSAYDLVLGKTDDLQGTIKKIYDAYNSLNDAMKQSGTDMGQVVAKMTGLQKASLALGKALVRAGLSANAAKIAMAGMVAIPIVAAITGIILGLRKLIKHHQEVKAAAEESRRAQEEFAAEVSKGAAPNIAKFRELQNTWSSLSTDMAKTEFLENNKKAFDNLGMSVNSLADAQKALVDNAEGYVRAQMEMAKADIYRAQAQQKTEELLNMQARLENTPEGKKRSVEVQETYVDDMGNYVTETVTRRVSEREALAKDIESKTKEIEGLEKKVIESIQKGNDLLYPEYGVWLTDQGKNKNNKTPKGKEADPQKEREKAISEYGKSLERLAREVEEEITKEQINAIDDGTEKILRTFDHEKSQLLDRAEETGKAMSELFKGNVDLLNRPQIDALRLAEKGWEDAGEGIATVFSSSFGVMDSKGKLHEILVTPILPDGSVLSPDELDSYIGDVIDGADDILAADKAGVVIAVDVDENAGEKLHEMQEVYYDLINKINSLDTAKRDNYFKGLLRNATTEPVEVEEVEDPYSDLIQRYGSYEDKRVAIHLKFLGKINAADEEHKKLFQRAMEEELLSLEMSQDKVAGVLTDPMEKTAEEISVALDTIDALLNNPNGNLSPENIKVLQDARDKLVSTQLDLTPGGILNGIGRNLRNGGKGGYFESLSKVWKDAKPQERTKAVAGFVTSISDGMRTASEYMMRYAEASGNTKMKEVAEQTSAAASFIGDTAKGFAQGGLIGGAVAAVGNALKQTAEAFTRGAAETREMKENAEDFAHAMKLASLTVDSDEFKSIFGEDRMGLLREYSSKAAESTRAYRSELSKLNGLMVKTKDNTGWANLWGVRDEYTSLRSLAPQIWKNGDLNVEAAEAFLSTNTQITDEQRKQIQNLVDLKKAQEENLEALKSQISSTFGNLSDSLGDALVNAIRSGENEMYALRDVGLDVVNNLERQLVSGVFNDYLSGFQDRILGVIGSGGDETELMSVYSEIFQGLDGVAEVAAAAARTFEAQASEYGWDIENGSSNVSASSKGFQAMSQETGSELNGRFTALQISNEGILQSASYIGETMREMVAAQYRAVTLADDALRIQADSYLALIAIRDNTGEVVKPIKGMYEKMDSIERKISTL